MDKITQFIKEVRHELSKVSWPDRKQTVQYTLVVVGVSLAMAVFLGLLDFVFEWILNRIVIR